ncbi:hypothetical protein [Alloprevotella tannerae]|uniref:hypothetical protein n=1 Tax=Alloprevotella tannerae TaxID=76122 RepID=UPI0028E6F265|nr:hypothetical protein [Alloprevotella tannerae]
MKVRYQTVYLRIKRNYFKEYKLTLVGDIGYFPYHFSDKNAEKIELLDCPFDVTFKK